MTEENRPRKQSTYKPENWGVATMRCDSLSYVRQAAQRFARLIHDAGQPDALLAYRQKLADQRVAKPWRGWLRAQEFERAYTVELAGLSGTDNAAYVYCLRERYFGVRLTRTVTHWVQQNVRVVPMVNGDTQQATTTANDRAAAQSTSGSVLATTMAAGDLALLQIPSVDEHLSTVYWAGDEGLSQEYLTETVVVDRPKSRRSTSDPQVSDNESACSYDADSEHTQKYNAGSADVSDTSSVNSSLGTARAWPEMRSLLPTTSSDNARGTHSLPTQQPY